MTNIYLYGPPASGKTTIGRKLSERLDYPFVDLDEEIVRSAGKAIPEIFAVDGEPAFRELESKILKTLGSVPKVVALGGGTLLREENREFCERTGQVICLEAPSEDELNRRLALTPGSRPLGNRSVERARHYASFPRRLTVGIEVEPSLVLVGKGIAEPLLAGRKLVMDATVAGLYAHRLPRPMATIPSGEKHKTLETVNDLWHQFAAAGIGRRDRVVAVGGGVTGDLTGFAAATWMRGIDWINVPTTLLSMVDASTGGKTGCDLPEGKNLVGAFHPPRLVIVDTDFLASLSPALVAAGRSEMIKHAIIGGRRPEGDLKKVPTALELAANLQVKVDIVRSDPLERRGRRILLNCGHTVAHAVEKLTDYRYSHGEAVAVGCVEEARLAVRLGLASSDWPDELAAVFASAGLPTAMPDGFSWEKLRPVMLQDKKKAGTTVEFALPCGWGRVVTRPLDLAEAFKG